MLRNSTRSVKNGKIFPCRSVVYWVSMEKETTVVTELKDFADEKGNFGIAYDCACGGHRFATQIYDSDGVAAIARLLPTGSVVLLVADAEPAAGTYASRLRHSGISVRITTCEEEEKSIGEMPVDDDVRMVVALGGNGCADCAKRLGRLRRRPVFITLTSPAAATVLHRNCTVRRGDTVLAVEGVEPKGAAIARDLFSAGDDLPGAFGGICTAAVALFDREVCARTSGRPFCAQVTRTAYDLVYCALDLVRKYDRNHKELPQRLAEISLKLSLLSQADGKGNIVGGAAYDCARTAAALLRREDRVVRPYGQLAFIFGTVLCRIYREWISCPAVFTPPPDNNRRAELLSEYFGLDEFTAARIAVRRWENTALAAYRLNEYRSELSASISDAYAVFDEAGRYFRRLHADDGYGLRNYLDSADVRTVVALAPDFFPASSSALTLMRELGFLDRYL